ncbi:MAG: helix-turn-helix domain-containing protein [Parvibaculaceae bacterium]
MTIVPDIGGAFSRNLRKLCEQERSIAEVCREIGINRQQFNKYLSGAHFPSRSTLRRICEHFGIGETDILRAPADFSALLARETEAEPKPQHFTAALDVEDAARECHGRLRRFAGYYYSYYTSPICDGMIIRSVSSLEERSGAFYSKGVERLRTDGTTGRLITSKFEGQAACIGDRIYFLYASRTLQSNLCLVVLYPSYRSAIDLLTGVSSGVSSGPARQPFSGYIVYEYLGADPDLRSVVRGTGVFPFESSEIRPEIRSRLKFGPSTAFNYLVAPPI